MRTRIAALSLLGILAVARIAAGAPIDDKAAAAIAAKAGCVVCHSLDQKGVGPSYIEIAKKHKANKDAATVLAKKVRDGGSGGYGPMPMVPIPAAMISDADLKAIIEWIRTK